MIIPEEVREAVANSNIAKPPKPKKKVHNAPVDALSRLAGKAGNKTAKTEAESNIPDDALSEYVKELDKEKGAAA